MWDLPPSTPGRKSCPITCAKRLGEFLGDERIKDKGLNCKWVVSKRPDNLPTSERAIPVSIFSAEPAVSRAYLRKWCGDLGCSGGEEGGRGGGGAEGVRVEVELDRRGWGGGEEPGSAGRGGIWATTGEWEEGGGAATYAVAERCEPPNLGGAVMGAGREPHRDRGREVWTRYGHGCECFQ